MPTGEAPWGRPPTSHERQSGQPWDASYRDGPAPWDIGEPQPAVVRLAEADGFSGPVLDAGCGTGDNGLYLASRGLPVVGVDVAETAVAIANRRAAALGLDATFTVGDALDLRPLGRAFRTVLDCGLFHTFDATERRAYVASLAGVVEPGATVHILCFSDAGPAPGPHPVSRAELAEPFASDARWQVVAIEPDTLRTRFSDASPAWSATVRRGLG
ncbi:class I SAM-dependent methyltransferase [Nocardia asteroides]|uniref:class I SAM-dependent methyltransferase n=1 Tax=Nocardia asteroides TaxID=1824 RepID=UPI001E425EB6|nr:class I SAM-dependent methyltransferase [Nocardia asteroides]UGT55712.1 class I SAM-dependent methyltransferase [Nocardia asteroides]